MSLRCLQERCVNENAIIVRVLHLPLMPLATGSLLMSLWQCPQEGLSRMSAPVLSIDWAYSSWISSSVLVCELCGTRNSSYYPFLPSNYPNAFFLAPQQSHE